jgi:hypothetical protein
MKAAERLLSLEQVVRHQQDCLVEALAAILPVKPGSDRDKAWQKAQDYLQAAQLVVMDELDAEDAK